MDNNSAAARMAQAVDILTSTFSDYKKEVREKLNPQEQAEFDKQMSGDAVVNATNELEKQMAKFRNLSNINKPA